MASAFKLAITPSRVLRNERVPPESMVCDAAVIIPLMARDDGGWRAPGVYVRDGTVANSQGSRGLSLATMGGDAPWAAFVALAESLVCDSRLSKDQHTIAVSVVTAARKAV